MRPFHLPLLLACLLASPVRAAEAERAPLSILVRGKPCSAVLLRPADARALLVLAHGQIMNLSHPFMESISNALAERGIATLRFNFPYAEAKQQQPDPQPVLLDAVVAAVREGEQRRGSLPLLLGGKSAGALMAGEALRDGALPNVKGLVVLGYPLHAPNRPSAMNAWILEGVRRPMLLLTGEYDPLADAGLMTGLAEKLGGSTMLHVVPDVDHSFAPVQGSHRKQDAIDDEMADAVAAFVARLASTRGG